MNIGSLPAAQPHATVVEDEAKLKKSAGEFEALLIGQMLRSARESGGGWFGTGEDEASSTTAGYAEEQFARTIASQGGLGVATMLVKGLATDQQRLDAKRDAAVPPAVLTGG
jgi:Rod binding domain-containing protein